MPSTKFSLATRQYMRDHDVPFTVARKAVLAAWQQVPTAAGARAWIRG